MVVAAALPLLLEHGDRVTSRQIAEAAGIAEGTIFRAFADKHDVITSVVEAALDPAPLEAALGAIDPALEFDAHLEAMTVILQQRVIDVWRLLSSVGPRYQVRRPVADSPALIAFFERHRDRITVAPAAAARLLRALTLSTTHPMLGSGREPAGDLVHLFLHGVGLETRPELAPGPGPGRAVPADAAVVTDAGGTAC